MLVTGQVVSRPRASSLHSHLDAPLFARHDCDVIIACVTKPAPASTLFPERIDGIRPWAEQNQVPFDEARRRFLQAATLQSIAADPALADRLVLQGASAFRLFHGLPRRSNDLDFKIRNPHAGETFHPQSASLDDRVRVAIAVGLRARTRGLPMASALHPDAIRVDVFLKPEPLAARVVSLPDPVVVGGVTRMRVACLEQLLAGKLHAIISAPWRRRRNRARDVWDVAWVATHLSFDAAMTARSLTLKLASENRSVPWEQMLPLGLEARLRSRYARSVLPNTWSRPLVPFDAAWSQLTRIISRLSEASG